MNRIVVLTLVAIIGHYAFAQAPRNIEVENEVNEQLWKPFKKAWEQRNAKAFNGLHTEDILRVSKWGVQIGSEYADRITESYKKPDPRKKTIDFWFEHRLYSGNTGYEVGYLKIVIEEDGKDPRHSYSRFHVVLKRVDGEWKIAQDWDTNNINGVAVTDADFAKNPALDLTY
ncbi:MAG: nuclear transport factor 2 family protein [Cyclobacteriaceae bacterium]